MMRRTFPTLMAAALVASAAAYAAAPSAKAKAAFDRGERELAAKNYDAASAAYREAISASPGYAAAMNGLGTALFKQDKKEEAIAQYKAAIAADPNLKLGYFNLGYAARKVGDFSTAVSAYEKYTGLEPNDPDGFYGLGESYRQLSQPQKAIAAYETFLQKEKRPSEQKWIDKAKETIASLKAAAAPQPAVAAAPPAPAPAPAAAPPAAATAPAESAPAVPNPALSAKMIAEGDRLMGEKKFREASFAYQDASNADPNSVEALFKLGNSYANLGYYAQAIERWNRAAQLTPDAAVRQSAQDNIAKAQAKMAQVGGGSPQAQGKAPGSGPVADGTRAQAREAYEQGVRQINGREYAGAVASLTRAIQLEPTLTVAYVARGSAHIGLRRFAEAAADYQYALRLNPQMASPLYGLAEAYRSMNRPADARSYYEKYAASTAADARTELQTEARQKAERLR